VHDASVSARSHCSGVIGEYDNISDPLCVLLKVRDEFSRPQLPQTHFSVHASREEKTHVVAETQSCDTLRMTSLNKPQVVSGIDIMCDDAIS
jgi:hypothetical protein